MMFVYINKEDPNSFANAGIEENAIKANFPVLFQKGEKIIKHIKEHFLPNKIEATKRVYDELFEKFGEKMKDTILSLLFLPKNVTANFSEAMLQEGLEQIMTKVIDEYEAKK